MKKLILGLLMLPLLLFITPTASTSAYDLFENACGSNPASTGNSAACAGRVSGDTNPVSGPNGIIIKITNIVSIIAGAAAVILIIIAGIKYISSQGDSAGVKAAKGSLISIAIGIVVIVLSRQLIVFIVSRL